jgi:polysaccharide deacetylase family protein (PEP-CTERM system associated)
VSPSAHFQRTSTWHPSCAPGLRAPSSSKAAHPHLMQPRQSSTPHLFTVDVEEYFQVKALESVVGRGEWASRPSRLGRSVDILLSTLERHDAKGTFFVLGWLAKYRPEVVRAIAAAGHEVASHGFWHQPVTTLTHESFRRDIRASKHALEDLVGAEVCGYRAPNFSIVPGFEWTFQILLEEGYRYDSSLFPIRRRGYGYAGASRTPHFITCAGGRLGEFPLATTSLFGYPVPAAGGGYLRQFPFAVVRRAFREASRRCEAATFYIHPWELDPGQPRLPVSTVNRIRHYRGLEGTLGRVDRLLAEFSFGTIASHFSRLEAEQSAPTAVGAA